MTSDPSLSNSTIETAPRDGASIEPPRADGIVRRTLRRPAAVGTATILLLLLLVALFAPLLSPFDPSAVDLTAVHEGPSGEHLLGTDHMGRDVLSRLIFGTRTSILAAAQAVGVSLLIGVPLGLLAGYRGGVLDGLLSRLFDALMSVPYLILALAIVAALGPGLEYAMLAIGLAFSPRVFRVVRASAFDVRRSTFVEAATTTGCSPVRIVCVHVLPNALTPLLVVVSISLGTAVLAEASLSFLGLGVRPPTPSWGSMLSQARTRPDLRYLVLAPGLSLAVMIAAFTILGDAFRDAIGSRRL